MSSRNKAVDLLDNLRESGVDDTTLLNYIIYNWMSGEDATECLEDYKQYEI